MSALTLLLLLIAVALIFDFLNGFNDSANVVATMIASLDHANEVRKLERRADSAANVFGMVIMKLT